MLEKIKKIVKILRYFVSVESELVRVLDRIDDLETEIKSQNGQINDLLVQSEKIRDVYQGLEKEITDIKDHLGEQEFEKLISDPNKMSKLNRRLSISPTVWGDERRLHISEKASVYTSFFNTNSGDIYIDDYTFAGSNVSILTGSHEKQLIGLARRAYEYHEGRDIRIGKGVWLASNTTIIGPCEIGDNAVIAAGAVVTSGTIVPPNAIFAGIPAKKIGEISVDEEMEYDNPYIQEALDREQGILFLDGCSELIHKEIDGNQYKGCWMIDSKVKIYCNRPCISFKYMVDNLENDMKIIVNEKEYTIDNLTGELNIQVERVLEIKKNFNNKIYFGIRMDE